MKVIEEKDGKTKVVPEDTLNESIIAIRVALQKSSIKKSGHNSFSNFDYYELADFLPRLNELMYQEGVNDLFSIEDGYAQLILIKGEEGQTYKIPFTLFDTPLNWKYNKVTQENEQVKSMQDIQYLGALNTYYKRYLYLNAFGITDGEIIDSMDSENLTIKKTQKKVTKEEITDDDLEITKQFQEALVLSGVDLDTILEHYQVAKVGDLTREQKKQAIKKMRSNIQQQKNLLEEAEQELKIEGLE